MCYRTHQLPSEKPISVDQGDGTSVSAAAAAAAYSAAEAVCRDSTAPSGWRAVRPRHVEARARRFRLPGW